MLSDTLQTIIIEQLPPLKKTSKGWLSCNCPLCVHKGHRADRKGRFGIRLVPDGTIGISCFNCFFKARYVPKTSLSRDFMWFLETIGIPKPDLQKIKLQAFKEKEGGGFFDTPVLKGSTISNWKRIKLPSDSFPVLTWLENECEEPDFLKVANYAVDRNIHPKDIYWTPDKFNELNHRFILPFYFRNNLVGYTARYGDEITDGRTLRYINKMPDHYVYNLDAQRGYNKKYCLLHEGVLDAYITTGISCLGSITKEKIDIINNLGKDIIVVPDRDKDGDRLVEVALEQKWAVSYPKWGPTIKDAANASQVYGRLLTVQSIIESIQRYHLKIKVARDMDNYLNE